MARYLSRYSDPDFLIIKVLETSRVPEWMTEILIERNAGIDARIYVPISKELIDKRKVRANIVVYNGNHYVSYDYLGIYIKDRDMWLWSKLIHKNRIPWLNFAQSYHDKEERKEREAERKRKEEEKKKKKELRDMEKLKKAQEVLNGISQDK